MRNTTLLYETETVKEKKEDVVGRVHTHDLGLSVELRQSSSEKAVKGRSVMSNSNGRLQSTEGMRSATAGGVVLKNTFSPLGQCIEGL